MARESSLWNWLSCARRKMGPALHIGRIENLIEAGTPDVEFFVHDPELTLNVMPQAWLELKSHERPARAETPVRFALRDREAQIRWLDTRWKMGANAFFLLQVGSGAERRLYLAPGDCGAQLKAGLSESQIAVLCCSPMRGAVFAANVDPETVIRKAIQCRVPFPLLK